VGRENWYVVLQRHRLKVPVGKDVWTQQIGSDRSERTAEFRAPWFALLTKYYYNN